MPTLQATAAAQVVAAVAPKCPVANIIWSSISTGVEQQQSLSPGATVDAVADECVAVVVAAAVVDGGDGVVVAAVDNADDGGGDAVAACRVAAAVGIYVDVAAVDVLAVAVAAP